MAEICPTMVSMPTEAAISLSPVNGTEGCTPSPHLPSQILFYEILSRLPVKSLLRLRCVCRLWRALIDQDDHFITTHLNRSKSSTKVLGETRKTLYFLGEDQFRPLQKGENGFLGIPTFSIRSSLDGLLCFEAVLSPEPLHIANLSTRECTSLLLHTRPQSKARICQLIRDPLSGRYKLLLVHWMEQSSFSEILTLGEDSLWRKLDIDFSVSGCWSFGVAVPCVNGALHWTNGDECIIVFDIQNEKFRTLAPPNFYCVRNDSYRQLSTSCLVELDGFLNLLHFDLSSATVEIWVLNDYANVVWEKAYHLGESLIPRELLVDLVSVVPVYTIDGQVLFWVSSPCHKEQFLVYYHFLLKRFSFFKDKSLRLEGTINGVSPYVDSLISLKQLDMHRVADCFLQHRPGNILD